MAIDPIGFLKRKVGGEQQSEDPFDTRELGKAVRDTLGEQTPDEDIDRADEQLRGQGLDAPKRAETYLQNAKRQAVSDYGRRVAEIRQRTQDAKEAERLKAEAQTGTQRVFSVIGDLAGALRGGDPNQVSERVRKIREEKLAAATQAIDEQAEGELAAVQADRQGVEFDREDAEAARAERLKDPASPESQEARQLAGSLGIRLPEGASAEQVYRNLPFLQRRQADELERSDRAQARRDALAARSEDRRERREDRDAAIADQRDYRDRQAQERIEAQRETARLNREGQSEEKRKEQARNIESFTQEVESNIDLLTQQIDEYGTYEALGSQNADFERRINNIAVGLAKLADPDSVAREGEVSLARKGLVEPGLGTTNATAKQILANVKAELQDRKRRAYEIRGIEQPGRKPPPADEGQAAESAEADAARAPTAAFGAEGAEIKRALKAGEITRDEARRRLEALRGAR